MKHLLYNTPYISTIPEHTNMMSIIGKDSNNWSWFLNYFIQLMINKNTEYSLSLNFCYGDNYKLIRNSPIIDSYCIPRDIVEAQGTIGTFIKMAINTGYFVYFSVDVNEISAYDWGEEHINHDLMVVGYEDDVFDIADFFDYKYSVKKCTLEQLETGYNNYDISRGNSGFPEIYLLKENKNYTYTFHVDFAKVLIHEYLEGINSANHFHPIKNATMLDEDLFTFGINIYTVLKEYVRNIKGGHLKIRSFHILSEHKRMMVELLSYLCDRDCLLNGDYHISEMESIAQGTELLKNMVLKYNITNNSQQIPAMVAKIETIALRERKLFEALQHDICVTPKICLCENVVSNCFSRNIKYSGTWEKTSEHVMRPMDNDATASYMFKGNTVIISVKPENKARKLRVLCDEVTQDYILDSDEDKLVIGNLAYGYHYIIIYNADMDGVELSGIECKTENREKYSCNICEFDKIDFATKGKWMLGYGKYAYEIFGYRSKMAGNIKLVYSGFSNKEWNLSDKNDKGQALECENNSKIAACKFFGEKAYIDVVVAGNKTRTLAFYIMDCYDFNRTMKISVINAESKELIDERTIDVINSGIYVRYSIKGHYIFEFRNIGKAIGVVSAVFVD